MILAVDPSINNTGWAVVDSGQIKDVGVIKVKGSDVKRIYDLGEAITRLLMLNEIDVAVVEIPEAFSYNRSTSAWTGKGLNQKSLQKLNWAIGAITYALRRWDVEVILISATKWKGRRTKKLDKAVAEQVVGRSLSADEADAVLLALWAESCKKTRGFV